MPVPAPPPAAAGVSTGASRPKILEYREPTGASRNTGGSGRGMKADDLAASELMQRAAEHGNAYAQASFAAMLERGIGVQQDFSKAAEWYQRAAEQGLAVGQLNLSLLLTTQLAGEKDLVAAYKWMALAAGNGNEGAKKHLITIAKDMSEDEVSAARTLAVQFIPKPVIEDLPPEGPQG